MFLILVRVRWGGYSCIQRGFGTALMVLVDLCIGIIVWGCSSLRVMGVGPDAWGGVGLVVVRTFHRAIVRRSPKLDCMEAGNNSLRVGYTIGGCG
jgi:hypothetical protein